ncbi:carboxypeptidase cpdS [Mycena polygramma]|nr:carboxypeptidase cpdS [Mycena polygramma]
MRSSATVGLLTLLAGADAVLNYPVRHSPKRRTSPLSPKRRTATSLYLNNQTEKFAVNGTDIPLYAHDVGESYAGLLPIAQEYRVDPNGTDTRELFFWFFPSENAAAADEITIWLTGGPGCSSLSAALQENGPFLWQGGTPAPFPNSWSWNELTNIVYIEHPVGVGFTQGTPGLLHNEAEATEEFLGFWKSFVDAFKLNGRKVFITGESYGGMYVPYIADAMLNAQDIQYFNVEGTIIIDPEIGDKNAAFSVPHHAMTRTFPQLFPFNASFKAELTALDDQCGFTAFLNKYLVFPPKGPQPVSPNSTGECDLFDLIYTEMLYISPCFNPYHITDTCPYMADPILNPVDGVEYFDRPDVKAAINAPQIPWSICKLGVFAGDGDTSPPSSAAVLPHVIERLNKTLIVSGHLDFLLPTNGTLLAIQNMTWNGALGFQYYAPFDQPFFAPYGNLWPQAGTGTMGSLHEERGLTFVTVFLAGHQGPQYQPAAAFRQLEWLLGRVDSMNGTEDWTVSIN